MPSRLADVLGGIFAKVETVAPARRRSAQDLADPADDLRRLLAAHCDRDSVIFALGGGVIGDLAGFAAACYMRGIAYVQVPTTLLAQVDSSVGGKTGDQPPAGKNMIGAFHQPLGGDRRRRHLDTLPQRELVAGLAEVIKYGAVADDAFLAWIEASLPRLLARDKPALVAGGDALVPTSRRQSSPRRARVGPARDPQFRPHLRARDRDRTGHGTWLHGEAVGCGMVDGRRSLGAPRPDRPGACRPHRRASSRAAGLPLRAPRSASSATSS